jgi:hypothetical protein
MYPTYLYAMLLTQVYHDYHILSEMVECSKKWYDNRLSDIPQSKFNSCFAIVHEMNDLQIKHNVSKIIHKIYLAIKQRIRNWCLLWWIVPLVTPVDIILSILSIRLCMDLSSMLSAKTLLRIVEILAACCAITGEGAFSNSLSSSAKISKLKLHRIDDMHK